MWLGIVSRVTRSPCSKSIALLSLRSVAPVVWEHVSQECRPCMQRDHSTYIEPSLASVPAIVERYAHTCTRSTIGWLRPFLPFLPFLPAPGPIMILFNDSDLHGACGPQVMLPPTARRGDDAPAWPLDLSTSICLLHTTARTMPTRDVDVNVDSAQIGGLAVSLIHAVPGAGRQCQSPRSPNISI